MCRTFIYIAISFALGIAFGWWLGSLKEPIEIVREEVRYVELPPITKVIEKPVPVRETIYVRENEDKQEADEKEEVADKSQTDTTNTVADYFKRREYNLDFSTDTTGTFKVNAIVEANRLERATATIVPLQRQVENTVVKVRPFHPYIGGGVGIGKELSASLNVGALINEHHLPSVGYQRIGNGNYITINYGYVF